MKVILIGFMGSGKSIVGRTLAHLIEEPFIEMDELVLNASKRTTIPEIFTKDGETAFRELEIEAARSLMALQNGVVSTGGGVVMNKIIIDYLRVNARVIFLEASFQIVLERIGEEKTRPLFTDRRSLKKLYDLRLPLYRAYADAIVQTDGKPIGAVTEEIRRLLLNT